jgi:hypothetical protein
VRPSCHALKDSPQADESSEGDSVAQATRKRTRSASFTSELSDLPEEYTTDVPAKKTKKPRKKAAEIEYHSSDFLKRPQSPWKIGPHVSAAGGVENAILNAASIGCVTQCKKMLFKLNTDAEQGDSFCPVSEVSKEMGLSSDFFGVCR